MKYKIMLLFNAIIVLISLSLGYYSFLLSSNSILDEVSAVNLRDTIQISKTISSLQQDVNDLSTFIVLDPNIQQFIRPNISRGTNLTYTGENLPSTSLESIARLLASKDYISYIGIFGNNGRQYYLSSDGSTGINNLNDIKSGLIYQEAKKIKGAPHWVNLNNSNQVFIQDNKAPKIAMCRIILSTNTYRESGFLLVCINVSTIQHIYQRNLSSQDRHVIIIDDKNQVVSYDKASEFSNLPIDTSQLVLNLKGNEGKATVSINNRKYLLTYDNIQNSSWKVLYLVSVDELLMGIKPIFSMIMLMILVCLLVAILISHFISNMLSRPIQKLLKSMQSVKEGNFKEKVDFKFGDEIGKLGAEYNDMIDNLRYLIDKVYKLQLKEKEAELKALQSQINPHFLYNTLDSIYWKAQKAKEKDISDMVYSLSKLFRLTLNRGNEFTLVKNEKEFIEYYLLLQKIRFRKKLEYIINIDDYILNYSIPKLILQPFIENAIIHGTEKTNGNILVEVRGYLCDNKLIFIIMDSGNGMEQDVLMNLLSDASVDNSPNNIGGFAIHNIKERLNLYYDGEYLLNIYSKPAEGTTVEIIIPAKLKEQ